MNDVKIPHHVGIILDGNGRWAKTRGLNRSMGHKEGLHTLEELLPYVYEQGVFIVSIYVFSTENFKRSKEEVDYLMKLFASNMKPLKNICMKNDIKILFSGRKNPLSKEVLKTEDKLMDDTKDNKRGILNICLNYGCLSEIVDMIHKISEENIDVKSIDEGTIYHYLYQDLPPLDLLIRTGGEQRLSNFMLCQMAYAEMYFTDVYFPDFKKDEFRKALETYQNRDRRFGGVKNEAKSD